MVSQTSPRKRLWSPRIRSKPTPIAFRNNMRPFPQHTDLQPTLLHGNLGSPAGALPKKGQKWVKNRKNRKNRKKYYSTCLYARAYAQHSTSVQASQQAARNRCTDVMMLGWGTVFFLNETSVGILSVGETSVGIMSPETEHAGQSYTTNGVLQQT